MLEVKRDVQRSQLAQCLEYAGWARKTNLDELAGMYHGGPDAFWSGWQEFTESMTPTVVNPHPRLVLVARDFHERTESAFEFLIENNLPINLIRVSVYEDEQGRTFVDVEGEHEPEFTVGRVESKAVDHTRIDGRPIRIPDLLEQDLLVPGDELYWHRPQKGEHHEAEVMENGAIRLKDGRMFTSPSRAAAEAAGIAAFDGWTCW